MSLESIANKHGVFIEEIMSPSRERHIVKARQEYMYELWMGGMTLKRIGQVVNRNCATVHYGIKYHVTGEPRRWI